MKCPLCGGINDKVLESRQNSSGTSIRRRRECISCNYRFTSYEKIEEIPLMVVKHDGRRQPFDIKKIERGLSRAVEKRPVPQRIIENTLHEIEDEAELGGKGNHEITSDFLGDLILNKLSKIDKVAYVRFASVYKKFENVQEFIKEINNLTI
jgi:transcriptional repressor NrdR